MNIQQSVVDKIDDKVADGKVVPNWRYYFHWHSVRWGIVGFFMCVGQAAPLAYGVWMLRSYQPSPQFQLGWTILTAMVFLAALVTRLKKQDLPQ